MATVGRVHRNGGQGWGSRDWSDCGGVYGMTQPTIDQDKLHEFMGKVLNDFGAALSSTLVYIGQKLGLYKAMAGAGWLTPEELAKKTGTARHYVREWLVNQAASGYVS